MVFIMTTCNLSLTPSQEKAVNNIKQWLGQPINPDDINTYLIILSGNAGTGKTTITKLLVKFARTEGMQVLCVAPTHKAKKVLSSIINTSNFIRIPMSTIAGLLGKLRQHSYIGTNNYSKQVSDKLAMYDFIIIDEVSMVSNSDYHEIVQLASVYRKKILFIGDSAQIPNPGQGMVKRYTADRTPYLEKAQNPAFKLSNIQQLVEITRNDKNHPLLKLYETVREQMGTGIDLSKLITDRHAIVGSPPKGYIFVSKNNEFTDYIKLYTQGFRTGENKIITYTNNSVDSYNRHVRTILDHNGQLVTGEILMGYENVGPNNDLIIENGQDYMVDSLESTDTHSVVANGKEYQFLNGIYITLKELSTTHTYRVFMPSIEEEANFELLADLVELAKKVNRKGSTKADFCNYIGLKSQLIFMEPVYQYKNRNYTGREMKSAHPLLLNSTADIISENKGIRNIVKNELVDKINAAYPGLLEDRKRDNKVITPSENLIDKFQILGKDIDYGYAITAHKSQGSTYQTVFLDENSFNCIHDSWSVKYNCRINRLLERDQLKYVGLSRARQLVVILHSE